MQSLSAFRKALLGWYERHKRDLPWRGTRNAYHIWVSEIMLQQTRVAAVIPYYERFLARFPDPPSLAAAPEADVLAAWAGLGYYSRARNLQRAAAAVTGAGEFPRAFDEIRALAGVGDYTAAAIASIAFDLPHAVLDGNVMRVLSRLDNDFSDIAAGKTRRRFQQRAQQLLHPSQPAAYNQAIMELGATVCLPKDPQCLLCPVSGWCEARRLGTQPRLPVKGRRQASLKVERAVLIIERNGRLLVWLRNHDSKLKGFYELPELEHLPSARPGPPVGEFRHSITNHQYRFTVHRATVKDVPEGFLWIAKADLSRLPVSTTTRKALACAAGSDSRVTKPPSRTNPD
ncbi:MAG: A/G-specific adenine glycosylase [Bryobacterales bacterium]|nr:A/G-specific adenine glycosylase [Bryobacterales bacterium]